MSPESGFQKAPNWPKIGKMTMTSWIHHQIFWCLFVSLVQFSYWSRFHVYIIGASGVMTIFFYEGLNKNPDIRNTPSEFCQMSGDWRNFMVLNLAQISLMRCYWTLQNVRVKAFTISEVLRENQQEGGRVKCPPTQSPPKLELKSFKIRIKYSIRSMCLSRE